MTTRNLHVIHLLVRRFQDNGVEFLVFPHDRWVDSTGQPYLTLPTKRSVADASATFLQGTSLEEFVDAVAQDDLHLRADEYVLERELEATEVEFESPTQRVATHYTIYPVDVWVAPAQLAGLAAEVKGQWLTLEEALVEPRISPTAGKVFTELRIRHAAYLAAPPANEPSMEGLALKWLSRNRSGVRHLAKAELDKILAAGSRAFNLRVADPYLRYQMQGLGFTWSFFSHKDPQDCHVHGAPVVEIYGILEGRLEVWWKPYYERGTSAWNHRILEAGDWLEVDSLQCHIVRWLSEGKGVVFKAGPGPLAEVGKLGVKGKTPCKDCPCMKPPQVLALEGAGKK